MPLAHTKHGSQILQEEADDFPTAIAAFMKQFRDENRLAQEATGEPLTDDEIRRMEEPIRSARKAKRIYEKHFQDACEEMQEHGDEQVRRIGEAAEKGEYWRLAI